MSAPIDGGSFNMVRPGSFLDVASEGAAGSEDDDVYSDSEAEDLNEEGDWSDEGEGVEQEMDNMRWHEVQALPLHDPVTGKEVISCLPQGMGHA